MPKLILHIDFNSFFASVEAQANPFLRGQAFAVSGKGKGPIDRAAGQQIGASTNLKDLSRIRSVITTASREAKNLGIRTAMGTWEAQRIIPNLPIIPGDPRKYADITQRFLKILHIHCDAVEQFSTDEAFADITHAAQDTFGAIMLAQIIRADIIRRIGATCTASIGIASNKVLAKLASESVKPNGITLVLPQDAMSFIATRSLSDICGIGHRLEKRLELLGVISLYQLQRTPQDLLVRHFGKHTGEFLWNTAQGLGDDVILQHAMPPKSIGHSYTFGKDLYSIKDVHTNLLALADVVAVRLRAQNLYAMGVTAFARYRGGSGEHISFMLHEPISDGLLLFRSVFEPLCKILSMNTGVRLLGIQATRLTPGHATSLFSHDRKLQNATAALDKVSKKYGGRAWRRGSTLAPEFLERVSGFHYDVPY